MPNEDDQNHLLSEFAACGEKSRRKKAFRDSSLKVKGLNQGFLKEIGDHLGHRGVSATRVYAKVNLAALREVAAFDLGGLR